VGPQDFGKSYALIVGVGNYANYKKLTAPAEDAVRFRNFLRDEAKFDVIVTLTDERATRSRIENLMERFFPRQVQQNDRFIFYFSGHGITRDLPTFKRGCLVLQSSDKDSWDEMIDMPPVREWTENLGGARHVLFMIDACFSGLAATERKGESDIRSRTIQRLMQPASHIVTAGIEGEESFIFNNESLFTKAFLAAARGRLSVPKDNVISLSEIMVDVNRFLDGERAKLNDKIKMTPHSYQFRTENNAGEFFFVPAIAEASRPQIPSPQASAVIQSKSAAESNQSIEVEPPPLTGEDLALLRARPLTREALALLTDKPSREFITAGSANERLPTDSALSALFLQAISGKADYNNIGVVSVYQIHRYIRDHVQQIPNSTITPQVGRLSNPDFVEGQFLFRVPDATMWNDQLRHGHALVIGNAHYIDWPQLTKVPMELNELAKGLRDHFDTVEVAADLEAEQLRFRIIDFITSYGYKRDARLFIWYAGHGYTEVIRERNEIRGYITGIDTPSLGGGTKEAFSAARLKAVSMSEIRFPLEASKAKHILFVFDSAFFSTIFATR
jgi:hypothetical protein